MVQLKLTKSYAINKAKHFLNMKHLSKLYYSMLYSYITYGIIIWGTAPKVHLAKLITKHKQQAFREFLVSPALIRNYKAVISISFI